MSRPLLVLVHILFLLSGGTALIYQVTWVRNLTLIFGASFEAMSITLAAFMGGIGLGSLLAGRYGERSNTPLRLYGLLEIGIAGFALALPSVLSLVDTLYTQAAHASGDTTPLLNVVRVALAFGILLLPTMLMGATLPVLIGAVVRRRGDFGVRLSSLYGINTLGALLGALAAGFVLMPALGLWRTQLLAVAINLGIGLLALVIGSPRARGETPSSEELGRIHTARGRDPEPSGAQATASLHPADRLGARLAFAGTAVSGACALALEVMWTRAVSISVGTTTYSFTVMLASFLVGIWLGSWLHGLFPLRRVATHLQFGFSMLAIGLATFLASTWIPRLPELVVQLNVGLYGLEPRIQTGTTLLVGFVVMLLPCIFMGIAFPLAGEARASLGGSSARAAGDTLGWNTLGAITGSLLAGFVITPLFGLQRGMLWVAWIYASYGCLVVAAPLASRSPALRLPALGAAATAVALAGWFVASSASWDPRMLGAFQNNQMARYVDNGGNLIVRARLEASQVLYYREGLNSTVSIIEQIGNWALLVNGKAVASDGPFDAPNQLILGHLPVLVHPDPKKVLVVGLGTGITIGSVTAHPSIEEITLVEIEPAVIGAQPFFAPINGDPLADPRVRVRIQDGRNYLKTTTDYFDVITADPIHPWNRGSGYLYTVEYYETAKERLTSDGVMCQWLPMYGLSIANYKSVVATFNSVFPHTALFQNNYDTVLIGSVTPLHFDVASLRRRLSVPSVARQLEAVGLENPYSLIADLALNETLVREYAQGAVLNTDDNLYLEFAAPLDIGTKCSQRNARLVNRYRKKLADDPAFLTASASDRTAISRHRRAKFELLAMLFGTVSPSDELRGLERILEELPGYGPARVLLSIRLADSSRDTLRRGDVPLALQFGEEAARLAPENAASHRAFGAALLSRGRADEALAQFERALSLRPGRWNDHLHRSQALLQLGRIDEAAAALRQAVSINPRHPPLPLQLSRMLEERDGLPPE